MPIGHVLRPPNASRGASMKPRAGGPLRPAPSHSDLHGWWAFQEALADPHVDLSEQGNGAAWSGSVEWAATARGAGPKIVSSTYLVATGHEALTCTHEILFEVGAAATTESIFGMAEAPGTGTNDRDMWIDSSGRYVWDVYDGANKQVTSTTVAQTGDVVHLVGQSDGTNIRLWVNGVLEGTTAAGSGYTGYSTPELVWGLGYDGSISTGPGLHTHLMSRVWTTALDVATCGRLYEQLWSEWAIERRYWSFAVAAGGVTYSPNPAVLTLAVPSPTFVPGAVTWTPNAAVLTLGVPAPTFVLGEAIWVGDPAVLGLNVPAPTYDTTVSWAVDPAVLTLTAPNPTFVSGAVTWSPDPAVLTLAVGAPTFVSGATMTPDPAVLTLAVPSPTYAMGEAVWVVDPAVLTLVVPSPTFDDGAPTTSGLSHIERRRRREGPVYL